MDSREDRRALVFLAIGLGIIALMVGLVHLFISGWHGFYGP